MAFGFIPLAGLALTGIAGLINRRRQARKGLQGIRGSAFGQAMNTQPQGPATNSVTQAATSSPTPPGQSGPSHGLSTSSTEAQDPGEVVSAPPPASQGAGPVPGTSRTVGQGELGAAVGAEAIARSRRRNREQQAALSKAATTTR